MRTEARSRLRPWVLITGSLVLSLLLAAGGMFFWLRSDADLRAADAEARAAGLPATWSERGFTLAPQAVLDALQRLEVLRKRVPAWSPGTGPTWKPGQPPPDSMRAHHAALPTADLAEVLALIDALPWEPAICRLSVDYTTSSPEVVTCKELARLLGQRVALAGRDDRERELRRLLHLVQALPRPGSAIHMLVRISMAGVLTNSVVGHLDDLRGSTTLPTELGALADSFRPQVDEVVLVERLSLRASLTQAEDHLRTGIPLVASVLAIRWSRAEALRTLRAWSVAFAGVTDSRSRLALLKVLDADLVARSRLNPANYLTLLLLPAIRPTLNRSVSSALCLRLLAAELDGSPWPEDDFAPPGTPLVRVEREGKLVFAYSVGENGVDDGGNTKKDLCFPLYGPIELAVSPPSP